jgi:hypothetical protein
VPGQAPRHIGDDAAEGVKLTPFHCRASSAIVPSGAVAICHESITLSHIHFPGHTEPGEGNAMLNHDLEAIRVWNVTKQLRECEQQLTQLSKTHGIELDDLVLKIEICIAALLMGRTRAANQRAECE